MHNLHCQPCSHTGSIEDVVDSFFVSKLCRNCIPISVGFQARYLERKNSAKHAKCGLSARVGAVSALVSLQSTGTCVVTLTCACHVDSDALTLG